MKKTLFLDIDGCLIKHKGNLSEQISSEAELLPGVLEKLNQWEADGCRIILTTGRKNSMRKFTEEQLLKLGIFYDELVMGLPRGERIVINDGKPNSDVSTARAIQIVKNSGLIDVEI